MYLRTLIIWSYECSLWQDFSVVTNTLTLVFDLLFKRTLTLAITTRGLIFHRSILCDKTFPWVQTVLTLVFTYLLKTLTLAISFWLIGTWTSIFHISVSSDKAFLRVPTVLTLVFDLHIANFNHAYIFSMVSLCSRILIFHEFLLWQILSVDANRFDLDLYFLLINCNGIFWMVCIMTLIFNTSLPWDRTLPWVPTDLTLWPWPWCLTYILKILPSVITFE
jgi:hypothetical protein